MSNNKNKLQTALSSTNNAVLTVAKSMLDEAGIIYSMNSNGRGTEIQVNNDDLFKARKLLHELEELDFETND
jgi:hypothetical protein